jgi:hypothetical protein
MSPRKFAGGYPLSTIPQPLSTALLILRRVTIVLAVSAVLLGVRLYRNYREPKVTENESYAPYQPPPLEPFSRSSPRFAQEMTFEPFAICPTPDVIGEPQYFATAGFDSLANPLSRLAARFSDRPYRHRKMRQPEQRLIFKSSSSLKQIYPQLERHFRKYGYTRDTEIGPNFTFVNGRIVDRNGALVDIPPSAATQWRFRARYQLLANHKNGTTRFEDIRVSFNQHTDPPPIYEFGGVVSFHGIFRFTTVEIWSEEERFWVPHWP